MAFNMSGHRVSFRGPTAAEAERGVTAVLEGEDLGVATIVELQGGRLVGCAGVPDAAVAYYCSAARLLLRALEIEQSAAAGLE